MDSSIYLALLLIVSSIAIGSSQFSHEYHRDDSMSIVDQLFEQAAQEYDQTESDLEFEALMKRHSPKKRYELQSLANARNRSFDIPAAIRQTFSDPSQGIRAHEIHRLSVISANAMKMLAEVAPDLKVAGAPSTPTQSRVLPPDNGLRSDFSDLPADRKCKNIDFTFSYEAKLKAPKGFCPLLNKIKCDPNAKYRSFDGSCNNQEHPWFGAATSHYQRMLNPCYDDRVSSTRTKTCSGKPLPNARLMNLVIHTGPEECSHTTSFYTFFGQFVTHGMTGILSVTDRRGNPIECDCSSTNNPECLVIPIPSQDRALSRSRCLAFARSSSTMGGEGCDLGGREQTNFRSSFQDLAMVYADDKGSADRLRTMSNGLLKTSVIQNVEGQQLPNSCPLSRTRGSQVIDCFQAGDGRAEENIVLVAIHTLWVRNHNLIATELAKRIPRNLRTDNILYQEARRINIAMFQHIMYKEYLPITIGVELMEKFNLFPLADGYQMGYNPKIYPNIFNEFATAAFRYGHTMVKSRYKRARFDNTQLSVNNFRDMHINVKACFLGPEGAGSFLAGSLDECGNRFSHWINIPLSDDLFNSRDSLCTRNIHRGRDHGLQPYCAYRRLAGQNYCTKWSDLTNLDPNAVQQMASLFESCEDVDLFSAGSAEKPLPGAVVGPTFGHIIAKQFFNLKFGDSFYYENGHNPITRFSLDFLREIRKVSMAQIICANYKFTRVQTNPFLLKGPSNPDRLCSSFTAFDFSKWAPA